MFGHGIEPSKGLAELLDSVGRIPSTDAQIIRQMRYEQDYGIVNHSALEKTTEEVFALVSMNDCENAFRGDMMHERARRFYKLRLFNITGMSWDNFIQLPKAVCDMWFEIAEEHNRTEGAVADSISDALSGIK